MSDHQQALVFDGADSPAPIPATEAAAAEDEVARAFADGRLRVEVDAPRTAAWLGHSQFVGCNGIAPHEEVRLVHVISRTAGGEVRGYVIARGTLRLRGPAYAGDWPEMDAAVVRATGVPLEPFVMGVGHMPMPRVAS